ncbi:glycosyltransferase, partial [bacterium]|nr:glycosyltransferase [bacterium]
LNMFINFSVYPLRVSTFLGFCFSVLGGVLSIWWAIEKIINPEMPAGITSIFVAILVFAGIQLLMLGLIGEYLGKLSLTNNQSPQYVIRHILTSGTEDTRV